MQRLTLDELLLVTDTPINAFKALRIRKQLALAFGRSDAYASLSYVKLDGVALMLAESHGRQFAAHLVCGAGGIADEEIAAKIAATPQAGGAEAKRIVCVNLTRLIRFMREHA